MLFKNILKGSTSPGLLLPQSYSTNAKGVTIFFTYKLLPVITHLRVNIQVVFNTLTIMP